ncbi:MAG: PaREP1 family protein [Thermoproteus sp.]
MEELPKPWLDPARYKEVRLKEALYEAEIAERFLETGLVRNAAGKAFQAWKALVAAFASDKLEDLKKAFPGYKRLRGQRRRVERALWIVAVMPTSRLKIVAQLVGGDVDLYTNLALLLHEYQYNGPDAEGVLSVYQSDESAARDVAKLLAKIKELVQPRP